MGEMIKYHYMEKDDRNGQMDRRLFVSSLHNVNSGLCITT